MKEVFLKKRYGIPAALVMLLVLAGVATAVVVKSFTYQVLGTQEPLTFTELDGLDITHQGETDTITVKAENACTKQDYGIFVDTDVVKGDVSSISYSDTNLISREGPNNDLNTDGDLLDACYNIGAYTRYNIDVTVDTTDDAAPGDLEIHLNFHRKAAYQTGS